MPQGASHDQVTAWQLDSIVLPQDAF